MNIEEIRVYNPKDDGITYQTLIDMQNRGKKASDLSCELSDKVVKSEVSPGVTLENFLWGENGYFKPFGYTPVTVVFLDGKFHSQYTGRNEPMQETLENISQETGGIPFAFSYDLEVNDYFEKQEFFEAFEKQE